MGDHMTTQPAMTVELLRAELTHVAAEFDKYVGMDLTARQLRIAVKGMADDIRQIAARLSGMVAVPEGWRRVPYEPTTGMCRAGLAERHDDLARSIYRAMLDAAPEPPHV